MSALEFFESIPRMQARVDRLRQQMDAAYAQAGPQGQRIGTVGGGSRDAMAPIDGLIDSDAAAELERAQARLEAVLDRATDVLYGRSGRGGLAKAASYADADVLMWRYCVGESWTAIGCRLNRESACPSEWARKRAERAIAKVDRVGMDVLADS